MPEPVSARLISPQNVPRTIALIISNDKATLHELQTVYGLEDLFDLLEIILIDNHNTQLLTRSAHGERH